MIAQAVTPSDPISKPDGLTEISELAPSSTKASSVSLHSENSTLAYQQTPFDEYIHQVKELCRLLWPSTPQEPPNEHLPSSPRTLFTGILRTMKVRRKVSPPPSPLLPSKEFHFERLKGGSFNRVIGITIVDSSIKEPLRVVLRIPRYDWDAQIERDVGILRYVRQYTSIPVPEVLFLDLTSKNPLKSPYVVQSWMAGIDLMKAHAEKKLSIDQWKTVAKELGRIILELQSITSPVPGLVTASTDDDGNYSFKVGAFDTNPRYGVIEDFASKKPWSEHQLSHFYKDTLSFFASQFGLWRAGELRLDPLGILYWDHLHRLTNVASQMSECGFFPRDEPNYLCHLDFAARNIMIEIHPDESLTISGILDWDSAVFAPKFVSCAPPWWIWQDENDGVDAQEDESRADETPADPGWQGVKQVFEDNIGEDFLHFAYRPQYQMARRLFRLALTGLHSNEHVEAAKSLLDDWEEYYKLFNEILEEDDEDEPGEADEHGESDKFEDAQETNI
ncbi:hypothetical protein MMC28_004734 [Mycoblastus sanguinarius]|nr:hypothetical protein [Mycoblastus sanguinarius]